MAKPKTEYQRAVMVLNSCQYGAIFDNADRKDRKRAIMLNCLERVGLKMADINDKLSIIHVAGSKGKGSTCEYSQTILRLHGYKTGSFSSPHLIEVRERIRINGKPVSEEIFCAAFWHVFDKLQTTRMSNDGLMPGYFGITLLMAFHIFLEQGVEVALLEVGIGGEYDATNFIQKPVACGIASLHLEHTDVLGNTVEEIGWHKSGICKAGVPLLTVPHQDSVMAVILSKAKSRRSPLFVAPPLQTEELGGTLGIAGDRQALNASLSIQLCRIFLEKENRKKQGHGDVNPMSDPYCQEKITEPAGVPRKESTNLTPLEKQGLLETRLPGRSQIVKRGNITYYLDGAHTTHSMQQCVAWFNEVASKEAQEVGGNVFRSLVFRMKASKKASDHLCQLTDLAFQRAAFCPHVISTSAREEFPDKLADDAEAKDALRLLSESNALRKKAKARQADVDKLEKEISKEMECLKDALSIDDSLDLRTSPEEAKVIADSQLEDWNELRSKSETSGNPCHSKCFPSIASALWWAGLKKDTLPTQPPLEQMAEEDLRLDKEQAGQAVKQDGDATSDDLEASEFTRVQVLVTGSLIMVGGVLTLIKPDLWE